MNTLLTKSISIKSLHQLAFRVICIANMDTHSNFNNYIDGCIELINIASVIQSKAQLGIANL